MSHIKKTYAMRMNRKEGSRCTSLDFNRFFSVLLVPKTSRPDLLDRRSPDTLPYLHLGSYITEHPFLRPSSESKVGVEVALSPGGAVTSRLLLGGGNTGSSCLAHGVMPSCRRDKCDSTGSGVGVRNFCVRNS